MEEDKSNNLSKKEANKYMRFLIKEWSEADNEVDDSEQILSIRRHVLIPLLP